MNKIGRREPIEDALRLRTSSQQRGRSGMAMPGTLSVSSVNSMAGNHTHAITASAAPGGAAALLKTTSAGLLTLQRLAVAEVDSTLSPRLTDTYDLGSSTLLWRKGWLAELDAVLFAQQTVSLVGGWMIIGHDEGLIPTDILAAATWVNFGKTMTVGDFVLFRAALKVEYMQVGTLVSDTTYNVTRNLDGSGANDWSAGTVFLVLGTTGDGRIELNSYDTPRISMITQGAAYNAQAEVLRMGDLNGGWGYVAEAYGLALGEYASGKANITIDPTNGLRLRSYTTTILQVKNADGLGYVVGPLYLDTSGGIYQGSGTFGSPTTGLKIWNDTGIGRIAGYNGSTIQWYSNTDGKLYAGGGAVVLDTSGLKIRSASGTSHYIKFDQVLNNDVVKLGLYADSYYQYFEDLAHSTDGSVFYQEYNRFYFNINAYDEFYINYGYFYEVNDGRIAGGLYVGANIDPGVGEIYATADARIGGGLYVGATGTDPDANDIWLERDIRAGGGIYIGAIDTDPATGKLMVEYEDSNNNDVIDSIYFRRNTSHASQGANGFGLGILAQLENSANENSSAGHIQWLWVDATAASRKARAIHSVYDNGGERECLRIEASGTAMIGFLGASAASQQAHIANPTDLATCISSITSILSALETYGLLATS